jgi:hypothetical protein
MPPMLPQQQLKEALKTMKLTEPVPYKKMKVEQTFTPNSRQTSSSTTKSNIRPSVDKNSPDFSRKRFSNGLIEYNLNIYLFVP